MTQLGKSGTMKVSGVRALWMEMISLLWSLFLWNDLVLDCLYNPQRSIILHTLLKFAKEAAYMKIINPERRVLNMYNALVVILSNFTPPKRRKVAFEGYLCLRQDSSPLSLFLPGPLAFRISLWFACCPLPSSKELSLPPVKSFPNVVLGFQFFWVHRRCHEKVNSATCFK